MLTPRRTGQITPFLGYGASPAALSPMGVDDTTWLIWLIITLVSFAVLEALRFTQPTGTLSRTLRRWLGIEPHRWWRRITIPAFIAALALFTWHIVIG